MDGSSTQGAGTPAPNTTTTGVVGTATGTPISAPVESPAPAPAPVAAPDASRAPVPKTKREIRMEEGALRERLSRARRQALVDAFGTDNVDSIRDRLARAERLEQEAEDRKRAEMTEVERLKHDLARHRRAEMQAKAEARALQERQSIREQQSSVERLAGKHVSQGYVSMATLALREHLRGLPPREVDRWTDRDVANWFKRFANKRPEIALSARSRARAPIGARKPSPRPATTPTSTSATGGSNGAKIFRPGQSNSMSRTEARAAAKKLGYSW